jgi:hypothetical protein
MTAHPADPVESLCEPDPLRVVVIGWPSLGDVAAMAALAGGGTVALSLASLARLAAPSTSTLQ